MQVSKRGRLGTRSGEQGRSRLRYPGKQQQEEEEEDHGTVRGGMPPTDRLPRDRNRERRAHKICQTLPESLEGMHRSND